MELDDIKNHISLVDEILSKTKVRIDIDIPVAETAQAGLLKRFRWNALKCFLLVLVFLFLPIGRNNPQAFPEVYKYFLAAYCFIGALWYFYLYFRLKKISICNSAPVKLFSQTTRLKLLALSGEIIFGVTIIVFLTLFLNNLYSINRFSFYLCLATVIVGLILAPFIWKKYVRLFHDLNSIKEG